MAGGTLPFLRVDVQQQVDESHVGSVRNDSKKHEDDLKQIGEKIKHHEDNVNYLKTLRNKLEDSIVDIQVAIGKHHTNLSKGENEVAAHVDSEAETIQHIMKYENSAASLLCKMKNEAQFSDHQLIRDVVGVVATLGNVDDANLSRLLSEYLGLETMLAVVCKSFEGVKTLETYTGDGAINIGSDIHGYAASLGRQMEGRFHVICLEHLRPFAGELIADDPQRRLNLQKPRLTNGETPPGFLGFAVNMVTIDHSNLYCISRSGHTLRETLFYNLFLNLQVYKSREEMLKAQSCITTGAISLDGGLIKSPGIFSLGHPRGDIDVKFPCDSKTLTIPESYLELENRLKETKWKKDRTLDDMKREQELLDLAKLKYETKKNDFLSFIAKSSSHASQMEKYMYVNVKFGGYWVGCTYTNGDEKIVPLPMNNISMFNLRYCIGNMWSSLGTKYEILYLSRKMTGRLIKFRLTTDKELQQLCRNHSSPTVYVDSTVESTKLLGDGTTYVSSYDIAETSHNTNRMDDLNDIRRVDASSNWLNEPTRIHDVNYGCDKDNDDDDDDDEDYVVSEESFDSSSSEFEEERAPAMNSATFAEFAAWMHEIGGMPRVLEMMYPSVNSDVEYNPNTEGCLRNWIVPMIPPNAMISDVLIEENPILDDLGEGSIFNDKEDLNIAAGLWNLERRAEYRVIRSDTHRLHWVCKLSSNCSFVLRAHCHGGSWVVAEFCGHHTCIDDITNIAPRKVHSKVIGAFFAKKMRNANEIIRPKTIQKELRSCFGMNVNYDFALRGMNQALEMIYGKYQESFQLLPGYLHMLKVMNQNTITDLDVGPDGRFRHLFVALGACRAVFTLCMRPVIVVDATHLKGKNNGILFVAVTKDANEHVYPLAFGIGPIENHESWIWFLTRVRSAYGSTPNTLIVSDANVSIEHAVSIVFPEVTYGLCYYHLSGKIKRFGKTTVGLFQKAAYTYRQHEYQRIMSAIQAAKPDAHEKLMRVGPAKWARSMCPIRRYSFLTSNAAESFNRTLLWARRLPICSCVEAVRLVMEEWFDQRRQKIAQEYHEFPAEVRRKLQVQKDRSRAYTVNRVDDNTFKVETITRPFLVDLNARTCECMEFQYDLIPCSHAIAAINNVGLPIAQFIAKFYRREAWAETYKVQIARVPHKSTWVLPADVANMKVLPNKVIRLSGQSRLSRRRSRGETSGRKNRGSRRCPHCDMTGHTGSDCSQIEDNY